jgi:hypothetical protein
VPSLNTLQLAWFDRWLKGIRNGIEKFPHVETYYLGAVIQPGYSLRLTIATGDFPHETSPLSTVVGSAGIDTLYLGADHPSSIRLGAVSPAPAS